MKKIVAALLALALGVSASAEAKVKITCLADGSRLTRQHQPLMKMFNEMQSEIEVEYMSPAKNYGDVHLKMMRASATNTLPDCAFQAYNQLPSLARALAARGQIVNFQDLFAREAQGWVDDNYTPEILENGVVDGKQYGMPFNASVYQWYYNNDLIKKVGGREADFHTWEGVMELAKKLKGAGITPFAGWLVDGDDWGWQMLILSQGGRLLDKNAGDKVTFNENDYGINALKMVKRWVDEAGYDPDADYRQQSTAFTEGNMGFFATSPAGAKSIQEKVGGKFDLKSTTFAVWNDKDGLLPTGGNAGVITTKDPKKIDAAWEYIKFVTGPKGQEFAAKITGYLPTNKRALLPEYLGDYYKKNPYFATPGNQFERAGPWVGYKGTQSEKIWREQRTVIRSVMLGETPIKEGAAKLQKIAEDLMQK